MCQVFRQPLDGAGQVASDVEAGRVVGASVVSRLHANPVFAAQMAGARKEIEYARAAGLKSARDCASEAQALARP